MNANWGPERMNADSVLGLVNADWGLGPVDMGVGPGLVNAGLGLGLVNADWGQGPGGPGAGGWGVQMPVG